MLFVPGTQTSPAAEQLLLEACHEMRQPVAGMLALTDAALSEAGVPEPVRNRLEQIAQQAQWLGAMVRALPGEVKAAEAATAETDLVNAANAMAAAERLTSTAEITVGWAGPVRAAAHPVLVRRLLTNLLSNAARAAGPGGSVSIEISRHHRWAAIAIEDSGPGFGRIQAGSGLGLPAASRIIARCGGRIECGSAASGGLRVTVLLPGANGDAANSTRLADDAAGPAASPAWGGPGRRGAHLVVPSARISR